MNTKDLKETKDIKEYPNSPLFTGNYRRDTSISEFEKIAEASQAIFDMMKSRKRDKTKE